MTPTQADREALYQAITTILHDECSRANERIKIDAGYHDHGYTMKAIIISRLAAEAAAFEKAAGVAEAIAAGWRDKVSGYRQAGNEGPYLGVLTGDDIATAIRKLAGEKHD